MRRYFFLLLIMSGPLAVIGCGEQDKIAPLTAAQIKKLPSESLEPTFAPHVPPPITRKTPARVRIQLETREVSQRLADGVDYTFWTFGGHVPGPFLRVRQGDYVDLTLSNHPSSKMPHNIDLHAVSGQGGGAEGSFTAPGHSSTFSFQALNPGLFIYHCATAPVGMHIANGMYGLILVEPPGGLPPVDKEYYIMQSEFYTKGAYGTRGLQPFDMDKAISEKPDYVVFNGSVGALSGDNALQAAVGDRVRLFVGNGGPNLVSSFHVIGEIFDHIYGEGGTVVTQRNVQTTLVPAGGSAMVDFKIDGPGTLTFVDHSIFRAFNKGAIGTLKVAGDRIPEIYSGKTADAEYVPQSASAPEAPAGIPDKLAAKTLPERMEAGKAYFSRICAACHQANGEGIAGSFPPLAKSDFLMADRKRAIGIVLKGFQGDITVNGVKFNSIMPNLSLNDEDAANVLTYIRNSWGNHDSGGAVTPDEIKRER